ncbi:MAG TPA: hypothetical protein VHA11_02670 [Bryobacteraceae bacterium]|nr:hypothetical protein [Bryobacteraceae bacterium]
MYETRNTDAWQSLRSFILFWARLTVAHFLSYVLIGGVSYMLIMRHVWANFPADTGLRDITSTHVQFWLWPAQLLRGLVLAAVFYPFRPALLRMGRLGGLAVAGVMIGIGCLAGFNGLIENLIFYRNVSLYLYYVHIPEILAQTLAFGYLLVWWEHAVRHPEVESLSALSR